AAEPERGGQRPCPSAVRGQRSHPRPDEAIRSHSVSASAPHTVRPIPAASPRGAPAPPGALPFPLQISRGSSIPGRKPPWTQNIPELAAEAQEYRMGGRRGELRDLASEAPMEPEVEKPVGNEQGVE
ncbi:Hypothetical predicted protein, partial [Lynx pardinus]